MIAYIQSVTTVKTEIEYAAATKESPEAHFEFWIVKSHCASTGVHWNISKKKIASDQMVTITMLILRVHVYRFLVAIRRRKMAMLSFMNIMFATYVSVARAWYW